MLAEASRRNRKRRKENIVPMENSEINLFALAVNIKSIAFRSNSSRRLFTFVPTHAGNDTSDEDGPGYTTRSLAAQ